MGIRILVVDDTAVFRRIVSDALAGVPGVEVVGTASNGRLALSRMAALQPDMVTLDIEMPEMNGIEVLEAMGPASLKAGVIVLSSLTVRGGELTVRALELGAFDFLTKPEGGAVAANLAILRERLVPMIRAYERQRDIRMMLRTDSGRPLRSEAALPRPAAAAPEPVTVNRRRTGPPVVLIGVSTGGPAALANLLPAFPADLGAPVLIVQHMPALFTKPLAASLDRKSVIRVSEAKDGDIVQTNRAYLAPGGVQMKLVAGPSGEMMLRLTDDPPENGCKPAVDYLFRSAALQFPGRAVAAILTGMGNDGTAGLRLLKRGGCTSIAQDEASCVVFGMPKEAIAAGLIDTVAPLDRIGAAIVRSVREGGV
ncbi:MAG TPA: chemotaxis response regulator protein-glutamate methylesterase [Bryobacteraceae bacterium]|nr:chemotaxis response regulator protein-glutamate methylesterase [Bryobacteraceae bacterium]